MIEYTVKVDSNGNRAWWFNGKRHREDGPAVEYDNSHREWWLDGMKLTEAEFNKKMGKSVSTKQLPTMTVKSDGSLEWRLNGKRHREDGPAVEKANGVRRWFFNGYLHREDGPAVELANGTRSWYLNGQLHREDGPAVEFANGNRWWYFNGKELTEAEFNKKMGKSVSTKQQPTMTVNSFGDREWRLNGKLHREDDPAIEYANGARKWYLNDKLHREDGPAIEFASGTSEWYQNGELHREDGPAIEWAKGTSEWYQNGKLHREDGPAVEGASGERYWYINGQLHREDGPAIEYANGDRWWFINDKELTEAEFNKKIGKGVSTTKQQPTMTVNSFGDREWRLNGELHREGGPAIEWANGTGEWYQNGKLHREDGPAIEWANGTREWYQNGELHREDGPAVEYPDGGRKWYLNGENLTEAEFNIICNSRVVAKNKRIRELAFKAAEETACDPGLGNELTMQYLEKFADMIISEYAPSGSWGEE